MSFKVENMIVLFSKKIREKIIYISYYEISRKNEPVIILSTNL